VEADVLLNLTGRQLVDSVQYPGIWWVEKLASRKHVSASRLQVSL
jgi:hypothetical protein